MSTGASFVTSPVVSAPAPGPAPDPFSPESLRVSQDFAASLGVKEVLTTVPVRKPTRSSWVRVRPGPEYTLDTAFVELRDEGSELYLVAPALRAVLVDEPCLVVKRLVVAIDPRGTLFVWPLNLPRNDGRLDAWARSALEAAELARTQWVRVAADMALGAYRVHTSAAIPDPVWPDRSMHQILTIAFRDRFIESVDHPVLKRLRGLA